MAESMTHDSVERPSLGIAEVAVLGKINQQGQQEEHHHKHDATFHRGYRL